MPEESNNPDLTVVPFLRWAGGKRWLAPLLAAKLRERLLGTYREPFLGAGALFFAVKPTKAELSDINGDLINAFEAVAKHPTDLMKRLKPIKVNSSTYYRVRKSRPYSPLGQAVRFIYLNRTCYGGIHRTNRTGKFNVPYGGGSRTPELLWRDGVLRAAAAALAPSSIRLCTSDFGPMLEKARVGDVVYCDPTYATGSREVFDRYSDHIFLWEDQERLAEAAMVAASRGALVVISNTYCKTVRDFYSDAIHIHVKRKKSMGKTLSNHSRASEYLIVLDPADDAADWASIGEIERSVMTSVLQLPRIPLASVSTRKASPSITVSA